MKKLNELIVGLSLYKHIPMHGIFHYVVIGIREYADNTQYELECETCTHGEKCRILVGGKSGRLAFIQVLNDEENEHYYWHSDSTPFYFKKEHADLHRVNAHLSSARTAVQEAEKMLEGRKNHEAKLLDMKVLLENQLKELDNPKNQPQLMEKVA